MNDEHARIGNATAAVDWIPGFDASAPSLGIVFAVWLLMVMVTKLGGLPGRVIGAVLAIAGAALNSPALAVFGVALLCAHMGVSL